jgi:hypothetical protein
MNRIGVVLSGSRARWLGRTITPKARRVYMRAGCAFYVLFDIREDLRNKNGSNNAQGKRGQYIYVGVRQTNLNKSSHSPVE